MSRGVLDTWHKACNEEKVRSDSLCVLGAHVIGRAANFL
jgi:hypothetical protein